MKQAARVQRQMEEVQAQLASRTVEATSGGGAVKVVAKCDGSIASIKIDPQAANPVGRSVAGRHDPFGREQCADASPRNLQ